MSTFNQMFSKGEFYPPIEHKDRINRYKENKLLIEGKHGELFRKHNFNRNGRLYVSVNLAGIIAKKSADFLIGDGVQVSAGKEDNSKEQVALDRIKDANDLDILFYESALANAYRGDSFFKVRFGQEYGGMYPPEFDNPRVIIETLDAGYVFPEVAKHNKNLITAYHVAIPIRIDDESKEIMESDWVLNIESHYAGKIIYNQFKLTVMVTEADGTPIDFKIGDLIGSPQEVFTGVPVPLVVHVPNFSLDDHWEGLDDLSELKPLFDELNNRLSQVASILDKHSDPAIALPMGLLTEDEQGRPIFNVANSKVFEIDGNSKDIIPQYVTWNGQLQEAYSEIDRIIDMILITAEIPAVALGKGDSGTSGSSGLAIRFRLNSLLAKIKRKRKYYEKGLKRVFLIAQYLESVVGISDYEITTPKLTFTDGLDKDELQEANLANIRTGGAVTMSQKTAIMKLDGLTEEQADAEIARIEEEQSAQAEKEATASPSIFNDLEDDEEEAEQPAEEKEATEEEQE
ncbi:phage portal protein [Bacillus sp. FSL K6-0993]|uniref:phage portal protein n=1 Tax=Bacillus sp. FSL K6-0993 TaxID=2921456 RepID=UPI0030ED432D